MKVVGGAGVIYDGSGRGYFMITSPQSEPNWHPGEGLNLEAYMANIKEISSHSQSRLAQSLGVISEGTQKDALGPFVIRPGIYESARQLLKGDPPVGKGMPIRPCEVVKKDNLGGIISRCHLLRV